MPTSNLEKILDLLTQQVKSQGAQEANLHNLGRNFDRHCLDDDKRHEQNLQTLEKIETAISSLTSAIKPLADAVATMQPIVNGYQIARWKLAGALMLGTVLVTSVGWIISMFIGELVKAIVRKLGLPIA